MFYHFTEPIRDPIWQNIYLSSGIKAVTQSPLFQKLTRIKQLGPTYHVYPGATHTRLNHSLGVFHVAKRIVTRLVSQNDPPPFTLEGVKSFLIAALLHDIGHFPYAHSLKELPLKGHEKITGELILDSGLTSLIRESAGVDPMMVASIVDEDLNPFDSTEVPLYRRLLSGVLDPDKLDYLNRDAFFCGVPYGMQDTDFYIDKMYYADGQIVLKESGITAIENILFSKYLMYKTVYWHKTVRIATAMIKKATTLALQEGFLKPEQLYGLDDDDFYKTVHVPGCKPLELIDMVFNRKLYKCVYEKDFSQDFHGPLCKLEKRYAFESSAAAFLSRETGIEWESRDVVIDIPEPISFEVDLKVQTENGYRLFRDTGSSFSPEIVTNFTQSLRKFRIFIPEDKLRYIKRQALDVMVKEMLHSENQPENPQ